MIRCTVNGHPYNVTLEKDQTFKGEVNKKKFILDIVECAPGSYHIIRGTRSFRATVADIDFDSKSFLFRINGNNIRLKVDNEINDLLQKLGFTSLSRQSINELRAPMPGLVVDVAVKETQEVKKGDTLVVLEAMKMENVLKAASGGVVKKIHVKKGSKVEKNEVIIVIEQAVKD